MKQGSMPAKVIGPILRRAQVVSMDLDAKSLSYTALGFAGLDDRQSAKQLKAQLQASMPVNLDSIMAEEFLAYVNPDCDPMVKALINQGYRYVRNDLRFARVWLREALT